MLGHSSSDYSKSDNPSLDLPLFWCFDQCTLNAHRDLLKFPGHSTTRPILPALSPRFLSTLDEQKRPKRMKRVLFFLLLLACKSGSGQVEKEHLLARGRSRQRLSSAGENAGRQEVDGVQEVNSPWAATAAWQPPTPRQSSLHGVIDLPGAMASASIGGGRSLTQTTNSWYW